jgi:hypothetical protein
MMLELLGYVGLVSSVYMTGVVWFAQLVHYPLLDRGDPALFATFARDYQRRTLWVVAPALAGEIASALLLVFVWPSLQTFAGLGSLAAVWVSTAFFVIPLHLRLKPGYDRDTHVRLVSRNWPRSFLWTLRAIVTIWTVATMA